MEGQLYQQDRRLRRHVRSGPPGTFLLAMLVAFVLVLIPLGWMAWRHFQYQPEYHSKDPNLSAKSADRLAVVAAVNQTLSKTGKDVPAADLVLGNASLHNRDGKTYLVGSIVNRSSHSYAGAHFVFDTFDRHHNPAGIAEGDVGYMEAGKQASFDIGPVNPETRQCMIRSIEPVEQH